MVNTADTDLQFQEAPPRFSEWRRFRRVFFQRKIVFVGLLILILLGLVAILAPWIAPYDPYKPDIRNRLLQPNEDHWMGTDSVGRDLLSRLIYGSRTALLVGFSTVTFAAAAGIILGLTAGYFGGITNMIIMRIMDLLLSFPMIILALLLSWIPR